jgi:hypothetical protein
MKSLCGRVEIGSFNSSAGACVMQIGDRVEILGGMAEFAGKTGTIIDDSERDGVYKMYRVRFDEPVEVPGLGRVTDDLWAEREPGGGRRYLRKLSAKRR